MKDSKILLGHGSGGRLTHDLIKGLFLKKFNNPVLRELSDSAFIKYKECVAFTTMIPLEEMLHGTFDTSFRCYHAGNRTGSLVMTVPLASGCNEFKT